MERGVTLHKADSNVRCTWESYGFPLERQPGGGRPAARTTSTPQPAAEPAAMTLLERAARRLARALLLGIRNSAGGT